MRLRSTRRATWRLVNRWPFRRAASLAVAVGLAIMATQSVLAAPTRQADDAVAEIRQQVSQVRGLDVRADVPVVPVARPALVERLARPLNEPTTVREFLTSQMLLEVLGAMPQGFDLRELQLQLLQEQTLAVYDYDERTVYLVAEAAGDLGPDERLILAHELTHALQDQHFGLRSVLPSAPQNTDEATAARALVEGDAMLTMRIWGRQHLRPSDKRALGDEPVQSDPILESAPPLVQGELVFPYDAGWVFAQLLFQDGGFAAVDQAFLNPPRSTEHILHPEKYLAGEAPVSVSITPLEQTLGGTWQTLRTDSFGELVLRLLLEPSVGWPIAEAAAAGWGGDVYTILEDADGRRIVGMVTVWDTETDAAEMFNAFVANVHEQFPARTARVISEPSLARWATAEYQIQVIKTDNVVRVVYAPDARTLDLVEEDLATASIGEAGPVAPGPSRAAPPTPSAAPSPVPLATPTPTPVLSPPGPSDDGESAGSDGDEGAASDAVPTPEATALPAMDGPAPEPTPGAPFAPAGPADEE